MGLAIPGSARISTAATALVATNVLVYRFDPRFPEKQAIAEALLPTDPGGNRWEIIRSPSPEGNAAGSVASIPGAGSERVAMGETARTRAGCRHSARETTRSARQWPPSWD